MIHHYGRFIKSYFDINATSEKDSDKLNKRSLVMKK